MSRKPVLLVLGLCGIATARDVWCPEPWKESQCIGTSGEVAEGQVVEFNSRDGGRLDWPEMVTWKAGMAGHSHYALDPKKTALFVIDPQRVYSECPKKLDVPSLIKDPSAKDFDGHSPLCCEKFYPVVGNANRLASVARKLGMPVHVVAHMYRDLNGDGDVDNCGRICDFDVLGWAKWPMAWNLWNAELPKGGWSPMVYKDDANPHGFAADFNHDFYSEKSTYSAFTKPVVKKLKEQGVDTVILTGFMTQYCITAGARAAHDLGFRVLVVTDAIDGPIIQELLLDGVDENKVVPLYLGVAVADTISTDTLIDQLPGGKGKDDGDGGKVKDDTDDKSKEPPRLFAANNFASPQPEPPRSSVASLAFAGFLGAFIALGAQRLVSARAHSNSWASRFVRVVGPSLLITSPSQPRANEFDGLVDVE